jgi:hypothetical protein
MVILAGLHLNRAEEDLHDKKIHAEKLSFKKLVCKRFLQANTRLVCEGVSY